MFVIFSVNEQQGRMMGFVDDDNDCPAEFETLEEAQKWCSGDSFAAAKMRYIFDMDEREIVWEG